jgi:hypothetical protein
MQLVVTLSLPRENISSAGGGREGEIFERARIEVLDWDTGSVLRQVEYTPPPDHLGSGCSVRFTGGCAAGGRWYQCTATEIVVYDPRDWTVERVISHPSFHDLHGVAVANDEIVIANTGLEMVQFMDMEGRILREVSLTSTSTWERFDRETDYRRVVTTKPHEIHPNHVFQMDGRWWVTRCLRQDAVSLDDPTDRIDIAVGNPHDGIVRGDHVYFTTTNARLVIARCDTRKVEEVIDLNLLNPGGARIGWCRGLEVEGDMAFVGFTRLRFSRWAETFRSAKDVVRGRKRVSHIERIDLNRRSLVDSYDYERESSGAIFALASAKGVLGSPS